MNDDVVNSENKSIYSDLKGKRVLVTGASVGIGAAIAQAFSRQGVKIILHYNTHQIEAQTLAKRINSDGSDARSVQCDFRHQPQLDRFLDEVLKIHNGIDIVINNAGIVPKSHTMDTAELDFEEIVSINLKAPYFITKRLAQTMIAEGINGAIINITSIHSAATCEHFSLYAMTKAALETMTKTQSIEFAPFGIRVNAVSPGVTLVERNRDWLLEDKDRWLPHIPAGRFGSVSDIGEAVLFLASSASAWTTGTVLTVDGGHMARGNYPFRKDVSDVN